MITITQEQAKLIATRRNKRLEEKRDIFRLIRQSYQGGTDYINKDNLFKFYIEDNLRFEHRLKRSSYTNHTQMLADMLQGFIYTNQVNREVDEQYSYIFDSIYKNKSLDAFMKMVCINSFLGTCGILIDNYSDIPENLTVADRAQSNYHPYAVFYDYERILDFELDDRGQLNWITLDNSYIDKSDPLKPETKKVITRLWTKDSFVDIETVQKDNVTTYIASDVFENELVIVPFIFVNAKDTDNDNIADSIFEDIAIKSRKIFNVTTWLDEALIGNCFRVLFMPYEDAEDIKGINELFNPAAGGIADIPAIPFKAGQGQPFFDGPGASENVDCYLQSINFENESILNKFGFKQESKGSWESGVAKSIDFSKTEAILSATAKQMEEIELAIVMLCSLYEGKEIDATITYPRSFEKGDIDKEFDRISKAFTIPSPILQQKAKVRSAKILFPNLTPEELKQIENEKIAEEDTSPTALSFI